MDRLAALGPSRNWDEPFIDLSGLVGSHCHADWSRSDVSLVISWYGMDTIHRDRFHESTKDAVIDWENPVPRVRREFLLPFPTLPRFAKATRSFQGR